MSKTIYVVGSTSNLFSSLLPSFLQNKHKLFSTVRSESNPSRMINLETNGVKFIQSSDALEMLKNTSSDEARVLWLSTHDDPDTLSKLAEVSPTLAISSGAIMDFYRGLEKEENLNAYKKAKISVLRVPNVCALVPGFYIEDVEVPDWASKGLHGETTAKLFSKQGGTIDYSKMYSVTPKSFIVNVIDEWISNPQLFPVNVPIIACSDRQYRRWELRQRVNSLEGFQPFSSVEEDAISKAPSDSNDVYSTFYHVVNANGKRMVVTDDDVTAACTRATTFLK